MTDKCEQQDAGSVEGADSLGDYKLRYQAAEQLFDGDEDMIKQWLRTPLKALGYKTPMQANLEDVKDLVGRIENGVGS